MTSGKPYQVRLIMKQAMEILEQLVLQFDIVALKSSFEDEGAEPMSQTILTKLCSKYNLKTVIKIGGCEAKSDFLTCKAFDTDILVAPMVETEYACSKFLSLINEVYKEDRDSKGFFINIETKTAVDNIESILTKVNGKIDGFVLGRSDLTESLGIGKKEVNSEKTYNIVKDVLRKIKNHNYITNMGGNVNQDGEEFVRKLHEEKLLDRVETRLVVVAVNDKLMANYQNFVRLAIELEKNLLNSKINYHSYYVRDMQKRVNSIKSRSDFLNPILNNENKLMMIDFDNVIHNMDKGFYDGTIYGSPVIGVKEALEKLSSKYDIAVHSCKANPDRPLVEGKNGVELIWEWLHKHDLAKFVKIVTFNKLNAIAYIDDKAIEFSDWNECFSKIYNRKLLDE